MRMTMRRDDRAQHRFPKARASLARWIWTTRSVRGVVGLLLGIGALCVALPTSAQVRPGEATSPPPAYLLGDFEDDYGNRFTVSTDEWALHGSARCIVKHWDAAAQFVVLQNHDSNPGESGLWTRIDWVDLPGMAPWTWAFCMSVYGAASADAAEAVTAADRSVPRTGCNGFPFSRMKAAPLGYTFDEEHQ